MKSMHHYQNKGFSMHQTGSGALIFMLRSNIKINAPGILGVGSDHDLRPLGPGLVGLPPAPVHRFAGLHDGGQHLLEEGHVLGNGQGGSWWLKGGQGGHRCEARTQSKEILHHVRKVCQEADGWCFIPFWFLNLLVFHTSPKHTRNLLHYVFTCMNVWTCYIHTT